MYDYINMLMFRHQYIDINKQAFATVKQEIRELTCRAGLPSHKMRLYM